MWKEAESIPHSLFKCDVVKEVWDLCKDCPIVIRAENMDFADIALRLLYAGTIRDLETMVVAAWAIWLNRNLRVFELVSQGASQVWNLAMSALLIIKKSRNFLCWVCCLVRLVGKNPLLVYTR